MNYVVQIVLIVALTLVLLAYIGSRRPQSQKPKAPTEIKTVHRRLHDEISFDREVNESLSDGWVLVSRQLNCQAGGAVNLVAFLEKYDERV